MVPGMPTSVGRYRIESEIGRGAMGALAAAGEGGTRATAAEPTAPETDYAKRWPSNCRDLKRALDPQAASHKARALPAPAAA